MKRWYAALIIAVTVVPVLVFLKAQPVIAWLRQVFGDAAVDTYIGRVEVRLWHLALLLSAGITVGLWWFADEALRRERFGRAMSGGFVVGVLDWSHFARGLLGLYSIAVSLYLLLTTVEWPTIGWRIWP